MASPIGARVFVDTSTARHDRPLCIDYLESSIFTGIWTHFVKIEYEIIVCQLLRQPAQHLFSP